MTSIYKNSLELLEGTVEENLYPSVLAQLQKDFDLANVTLKEISGLSPENLITTLKEKIYRLILEDFTDYLNLLYIIDVPESAFKTLEITDVVEVSEQVTFLILKRERQKVWTKNKYSQ